MADKNISVALYTRVSTQEQAVEGTSLDNQMDKLTHCCQSQGWQIVQKYTDPGFTGKDTDRPALTRLLLDARTGMFNKVIVHKLDRLARKLRLLLELEEKLKDSGVSLHSVKESIDTSTAIGRTVFQVLGLVSEWERETIVERTKSGRIQRYKEGCWAGGKPCYGYAYDRPSKKLIVNKVEARVVRRIYQLYSSGKSMIYVANLLNEEKIPPRHKNGKGWRPGALRDILLNPAYKGTQYVNRHIHISKLSEKKPKDTIKIKVPRIVTDALWESAQIHRKNNKHLQPTQSTPWLLQGLITCGLCGHSFMVQLQTRRRVYSCRGRLKYTHVDGSSRCMVRNIPADWLEQQVWQRIEAIINDPNKLKALLDETIESLKYREEELTARIRPIDERLDEIATQKARIAEDWVKLSMDSDKCNELQQGLQQEEARLRSIRGEIDPAQISELERTRGLLRFWEKDLQSMDWNTVDEKGQMFRNVDLPHKHALTLVDLEDEETSRIMSFPATKRELLDMLQVRLVAFEDRIELKAIFPVGHINRQLCRSPTLVTHLCSLRIVGTDLKVCPYICSTCCAWPPLLRA